MFNTPKNGKRRYITRRFSLTEILAVAAIITSIPGAQYAKVKEKGYEAECFSNLRQIGILMTAFNLENGHYPKAAFYPDDPLRGEDSISVILHGKRKATRARDVWICPALPDALKKKGLGFVYNDDLAGKRNVRNPSKKWMMIEINCVSRDVPAPHPNGYNILFADGHIVTDTRLPKKIIGAKKAMIEQLRNEASIMCARIH